MVEKAYEDLDLLLFRTDIQTLRDFSSHIGLDTAQTENLNKRKLLKQIRDFVGDSLDQDTESENVGNIEWIRFLQWGDEPGSESENESDDLQTTGIPDQDPKPSEIRDKDPRPSGI